MYLIIRHDVYVFVSTKKIIRKRPTSQGWVVSTPASWPKLLTVGISKFIIHSHLTYIAYAIQKRLCDTSISIHRQVCGKKKRMCFVCM